MNRDDYQIKIVLKQNKNIKKTEKQIKISLNNKFKVSFKLIHNKLVEIYEKVLHKNPSSNK